MTIPSTEAVDCGSSPVSDPIVVLVVTNDRQYGDHLETTVADDDLTVRSVRSITDAVARLEDVDCLVGEYALVDGDGSDLLERVRDRDPELPVVLLVDGVEESTLAVDAVRAHRWADCLAQHATTVPERLGHRIRTLVEHRRLAALTRRSLASVELAQDAVAIATPGGDLEFANRSFAMQFGFDRDALLGTPWRELFTDDSVERLETAAIPTVADGWRWTGSCIGRRTSGATFTVRIRLGGLEDGSLVFVVDTPTVEDETDETK